MRLKLIDGDGRVTDCTQLAPLAMGTSGQGRIECAYSDLVVAFGEPDEGDGYKTQAEWTILTPAGIATIYDWKQGDCYHGEGNGTPAEEVAEWSVGGGNANVVEWIKKAIQKQRETLR